MKFFQRWLFAIKINSWPKMLVPFLWGQSLAIFTTLRFDPALFLLGFLFTFFLTIFIVLLNDYWDQKVDALKRKLYPNSGSPKTIPDGILPAWHLLLVGLTAGTIVCLLSLGIEFWFYRSYFSILGFFSIFMFIFYSVPPIRLNYLGGGEFLEMFGVGFVLPFLNFYLQSGEVTIFHTYTIFLSSIFFALSSAIASGMSDEVSDRMGGKTTLVSKWGNPFARRLIFLFSLMGALALILTPLLHSEILSWLDAGLFIVFNLYLLQRLITFSNSATTDAFPEIQRFKTNLHILIWGNFLMLSFLLTWKGLGIPL